MTDKQRKVPEFEMTRHELEQLGRGQLAYVRPIGSEQAKTMMGADAPVDTSIDAGVELFCLYMADGTPVSISSTQKAAIANAMVNDLQLMPLN